MVEFRVLLLGVLLTSAIAIADGDKVAQESFIIKKQSDENTAKLSKNALKERMGEAVRESMHALFDNASCVVQIQKVQGSVAAESCELHEKIITLQRKFSNIAESLIEGNTVYKKKPKKNLEASLLLLRSCESEFKQAKTQLVVGAAQTPAILKEVATKFALLQDKIEQDICLKTV